MSGAKIGLQDKGIFADVISKPHQINLSQSLALYKVSVMNNNTLIIAMTKLFLYIENKKIKSSIRSLPLS